ncbi:MAG: His/Gly/Thr/Pro-type tRNA ligase C-terminal domain-containing protein [Collinsella aerofaciens]
MGFPYQVVLGKRGLKNGTVELKDRATGDARTWRSTRSSPRSPSL